MEQSLQLFLDSQGILQKEFMSKTKVHHSRLKALYWEGEKLNKKDIMNIRKVYGKLIPDELFKKWGEE